MTAFKDLSVADMIGASKQFEDYLKEHLGFDFDVRAEISVVNSKGQVYLRGGDAFQKDAEYSRKIGQFFLIEPCSLDADWEAHCEMLWKKLQKAMPRDEREMRHGLAAMSGIIEHAPSYQSAVGKMLADRVLKLRDEVNDNLIEYRRPAAE
jgi:hypothetical protein